ncbi:hypothetical protein N0V88_002323 [Collariella sp. IMI 366227]|nr:hypothetical protein N0V88_002323 [Collariella sp. IMI 366227]
MSARKTAQQVWHVSRGIVFAGGSSVVYPRLPQIRNHSAPPAVASEGTSTPSPTGIQMGQADEEPTAGRGLDNAQGEASTSMTASTISTTTTAIYVTTQVCDEAVKSGQAVVADTSKEVPSEDSGPVTAPFTPLTFKIPDAAFQSARKAEPGTPGSFWSYTLYRDPGAKRDYDAKVKVHYCTSVHTTERVIQQYFMNEPVLGLDLEWDPNAEFSCNPRRAASLIQVASPSRIGLFHIAAFPKTGQLVAPSLKKILESPDIRKVGVWIKGDCTRLGNLLKIKARGQFELSHIYNLVKHMRDGTPELINKRLVGLARQVEEILGLPMYKGENVRRSNWSKALNMDQVVYAASDAYAACQLYHVLDYQRRSLNPVPPLPAHAELDLPIRTSDAVVEEKPKKKSVTAAKQTEQGPVTPEAAASSDSNVVVEKKTRRKSVTAVAQTEATSSAAPEASVSDVIVEKKTRRKYVRKATQTEQCPVTPPALAEAVAKSALLDSTAAAPETRLTSHN